MPILLNNLQSGEIGGRRPPNATCVHFDKKKIRKQIFSLLKKLINKLQKMIHLRQVSDLHSLRRVLHQWVAGILHALLASSVQMHFVLYVERAAVRCGSRAARAVQMPPREADSMSGSAQVRLPLRGLLTLQQSVSVFSQCQSPQGARPCPKTAAPAMHSTFDRTRGLLIFSCLIFGHCGRNLCYYLA
jgi:hypothetical protein